MFALWWCRKIILLVFCWFESDKVRFFFAQDHAGRGCMSILGSLGIRQGGVGNPQPFGDVNDLSPGAQWGRWFALQLFS